MTSEGPHRPGQEPDEVSPGAGGPAPYGDRPAHPDNGYGAAGPDLGWAPPPPARPNPSGPAWGNPQDQPPAANWGAAPPPQASDPAQPAWATGAGTAEPPQPAAWTGGAPESAQPAPWGGAPQQGWAPEQGGPAWAGTGNAGAPEQPGWAQTQPATRGSAQVPPATAAWPAQDDPARSGGWNSPPQPDQAVGDWRTGVEPQQPEPAQAGGWGTGAPQQDDDPARSGGWAVGSRHDDPARSGGWAASDAGRDDQPAWTPAEQSPPAWAQGEPAEQSAPGWAQHEPAARGAAQVPTPASNWPGQDDPARSGGWAAQQQPAQSGGWGNGAAAPQDEAAPPAARGGGEDRPQQPDWVLAPQDQPTDRPEPAAWSPPESNGTPARATASVPGGDGAPAWAAQDNPAPRSGAVPEAEPWTPGEAWGRSEAEAPAQSRGGWETDRGEESAVYQPAPAPGISPANAVPLPPQEQRVPGASLASAPPVDYGPPAAYASVPEQPAYAEREEPDAAQQYEAEQAGWGRGEEPVSGGAVVPAPRTSPESGPAARAAVPQPEADLAAGAVGRASASASVPLASRVMPPTDQAVLPAGAPAPQPRVYGRPAQPEPENEPEQAEPGAFHGDPGPERQAAQDWQQAPDRQSGPDWQNGPAWQTGPDRQNGPDWQTGPDWQQGPERQAGPGWGGESGPDPRFDDRDRPATPNGFPEASAPPAPPAFPPGVPSFVDAPNSNRPVNGVRPQAGGERPADQFGGPGSPTAGAAVHGAPGFGPGPSAEPVAGGGFPPAFPPAPQQPAPSWGQQAPQSDQGRFDAFKPDPEPKAEPPVPKVRNGRVLAAVLVAAVLILAVPLGLLMLLGKFGGGDPAPAFDPAVGTCVKQSGQGATAVDCGEEGAFTVVSKVDAKDKCADPAQPYVVLPGEGTNRVLCLKPATK